MIIFANKQNASSIHRSLSNGKLKALTKGIYITNNTTENDIKFNISNILAHLKVDGIISYASALESDYFHNKIMWITGKRERSIILGDLKIIITKGNEQELNYTDTTNLDNTNVLIPNIYRAVLQNFSSRKSNIKKINKNIALKAIIELSKSLKIDQELLYHNLKMHAKLLHLEKEAEELIKELKKYYSNDIDLQRLNLFSNLKDKLNLFPVTILKSSNHKDKNECENVAFIESYFSNYIEGTEFEVDEAISIIFNPLYTYKRTLDGHDIKNTFKIIQDNIINPININDAEHYIETLKLWHKSMMSHRINEMRVGEFKIKKNKAGNTVFVHPEQVENMLKESFKLSTEIKDNIKKAFFLKTTFTEIHPFDDGNGRISRLILNNFLSLDNKKRIIIPNVFREDYLLALKTFSQGNVDNIIKVLNKACLIANAIPYEHKRENLIQFLTDNSAFCFPNESLWGVVPSENNSDFNIL